MEYWSWIISGGPSYSSNTLQLTSSTKLSEIEIVIQWIQIEPSRDIEFISAQQIENFPNLVMQFHNLKAGRNI